jgi:dethiobiotin synthetase
LRKRHEVVLVEGVGGLLVPVCGRFTVADMAKRMKLPVLVVCRPTLGTLNHTALTVNELHRNGLRLLGLVVCRSSGDRLPPLAERLTFAELERMNRTRILSVIPRLKSSDPWLLPAKPFAGIMY